MAAGGPRPHQVVARWEYRNAAGHRRYEDPLHNVVRSVSADDEKGTTLLVRSLTPPDCA